VRAEEAYRDWSGEPEVERPLVRARPASAAALHSVLREHDVSRNRLADMLGIDEKTVRQWLKGEKPIPLAAVLAMPVDMGTSLAEKIVDARAGGPRTVARAVPALREAVARIDPAKATPTERMELVKALMDVQARLGDLMRQAMG
jgi:transcriptional regulator with XRE-family HTH domain